MIHHSGLIGGAGISFYNVCIALEKKHEVIAYIPDDPPDLLKYFQHKGLNPKTFSFQLGKLTYYSGGNNLLKPGFWYHALNSFFQITYWKEVISHEQPDLIIVNSKVLCWMGKVFKKHNIISLCFVRETIPGNPKKLMNQIMRRMLEDFNIVVFLSEFDLRQTGLKKAENLISHDFLDIADYKDNLGREIACGQLNICASSFNVLFVGGINSLKGIDVAIKAIEYLKNEEITLIVAGNDSGDVSGDGIKFMIKKIKQRRTIQFSHRIKKRIRSKGIEEKVKFIGIQTDMSIPFSACDVLIFPMKRPHQARPAFEIGAQEKPVIISDFPNISEFIKNGYNGLTFKPNNPIALANAIIKLKNDKKHLDELGKNNYKRTIKYHTKEYAMGALIDRIDEVLY